MNAKTVPQSSRHTSSVQKGTAPALSRNQIHPLESDFLEELPKTSVQLLSDRFANINGCPLGFPVDSPSSRFPTSNLVLQKHLFLLSFVFVQLVFCCSCDVPYISGSESAARAHLEQEIKQWMARESSEASEAVIGAEYMSPPISYEIKSIVTDSPNSSACSEGNTIPKNYQEFPAYKLNTVITFESQAGTPLEKVHLFNLTWNPHEQRWFTKHAF